MFGDNIWKATERGDLEKVQEFVVRDGIPAHLDKYNSDFVLTFACRTGHP
jgi:hypothetical protein